MKKLTLLLAFISIVSIVAKAQDDDSDGVVHQKGNNLFNAGIGLGYYGYGLLGNQTYSLPALTANYEIGVHDYFGVGPYVGYKSYRYSYLNDDYGFNLIAFGARGSFHYSTLLREELDIDIDDSKWDLYILANFGFEITTFSGDTNFEGDVDFIFLRPALGVRYYFNKNFAMFGEGGRGALSYLTLGITLKM
ncbi:hypothetical protein SAMN05661096_03731 [Marivirga sericea]|uniref:Outer membrane protein beta-barrel domain-containing protein n=1 Tax=Marivirga sericea TaxID=1028 RepID=A0A1X7LAA4_9BACT|nr:hypothetical protein [Marivirga sericea]SMG50761.1 hypothetical protein SAMN05661096_03731 [Marivirga sericea]